MEGEKDLLLQMVEELRLNRDSKNRLEEKIKHASQEKILLQKDQIKLQSKLEKVESLYENLKTQMLQNVSSVCAVQSNDDQSKSAEAYKLKAAVRAAEETIKGLRNTISTLYENRDKLQSDLNKTKKEISCTQNLAAEMNVAKAAFHKRFEDSTRELSELQEAQFRLEHNLTAVNLRSEQTATQCESLLNVVRDREETNNYLSQKVVKLEAEMKNFLQDEPLTSLQVAQLQVQVDQLKHRNEVIENEKAFLESELKVHQNELKETRKLCDSSQDILSRRFSKFESDFHKKPKASENGPLQMDGSGDAPTRAYVTEGGEKESNKDVINQKQPNIKIEE